MIEIPQMCGKCRRALLDLAAKNGGMVFCSHRGKSNSSGVFVTAVPMKDGGCKLDIIYPCTETAAREKARQILQERTRATSR